MRARLFLFALLLSSASCMPLAVLQSGRSLGKGNAVLTPYLHAGNIYLPKDDSESFFPFLPSAGAQFSTGVMDRLDLGGKVDISSFMAIQTKYQLLGCRYSRFAMSVGAEAGVMLAPLVLGGVFYYYTFPAFLSYHPTEKLCFYAMPAYSFGQRYVMANANSNGLDAFEHTRERSGFSYGFSLGQKNHFSLEIGHYTHKLYQPTQVAVGYSFWFAR